MRSPLKDCKFICKIDELAVARIQLGTDDTYPVQIIVMNADAAGLNVMQRLASQLLILFRIQMAYPDLIPIVLRYLPETVNNLNGFEFQADACYYDLIGEIDRWNRHGLIDWEHGAAPREFFDYHGISMGTSLKGNRLELSIHNGTEDLAKVQFTKEQARYLLKYLDSLIVGLTI